MPAERKQKRPEKADPTRTITLRNEAVRDFTKRYYWLKGDILKLFVEEDVLGLIRKRSPLALNNKWYFETDEQKIILFQAWLAEKQVAHILDNHQPESGVENPDAYWNKYVQRGFEKGAGRAFEDVNKPALAKSKAYYQGSKDQFLRSAFGQPESVDKVKLLSGRVYTDLKGVTEAVSADLTRTLTDGLVQGKNPRTIAADINKRIDAIGARRATVIARTEIIRAHAEGQLHALENLGVEDIGVMVEWSTAGDDRVCPLCKPLEGMVLKTKEAHGMLPRHPQCRCAFIPANVDEDPTNQKRGATKLSQARDKSIEVELGKKGRKLTKAQKRKASRWGAAEKTFDKKRPENIFDKKKTSPTKSILDKGKKAPAVEKTKPKPAATAKKELEKAKKETKKVLDDKKLLETEAKRLAADIRKKAEEVKAIEDALAKAKALEAAEKARAEATKAKAIADEAAGKFPDIVDLSKKKDLPGSTRPELMENKYTGKQWVMKTTENGIAPDHLRSEALADELYRVIGLDVPKSTVIETGEGPVKISEFLEGGETLSDWLNGGPSQSEVKAMYEKISEGFVADALLANHDVIGLSFDNIYVVNNLPFRIDNGGALLYRARGAKKLNFGGVVAELDSMKDAGINATSAQVFAGVTDDKINKQIAQIVDRKAQILSAIDDAALRGVISTRIDHLAARLRSSSAPGGENVAKVARKARGTARKGLTVAERKAERLPEPGVVEGTAERVRESGINGTVIKGDRDLIEDTDILVWEEQDINGETVTRIHMKLTKKGSDAVRDSLQVSLPPDPFDASNTHNDYLWGVLKDFNSMVSAHSKDKLYDQTMVVKVNKVITNLEQELGPNNNPTEQLKHIYTYYKQSLEETMTALKEEAVPKLYTRYVAPTPSTPVTKSFNVEKTRYAVRLSDIEKGRAKATYGTNEIKTATDYLKIDTGDDVTMHFLPSTIDDYSEGYGRALEGTFDITIPGPVTNEKITDGLNRLSTLGINTELPTPEFEELLYLRKGFAVRGKKDTDRSFLDIWEDTTIDDSQKVDKLKKLATKEFGIDFSKVKTYNPQGKTLNADGSGYRYWERWDLDEDAIRSELSDYTLQHRTRMLPSDFVDKILSSGGEATPTIARIRKGISLQNTGGMSTGSDIESGGAAYFFTRLTERAKDRGQFRFKADRVIRQDAVTYDEDNYGSTVLRKMMNRGSTLEDYKSFANVERNETIFKHGLSLLDDLDMIVTGSYRERDAVLEVFRLHGVERLNDGRLISDVVKVNYND